MMTTTSIIIILSLVITATSTTLPTGTFNMDSIATKLALQGNIGPPVRHPNGVYYDYPPYWTIRGTPQFKKYCEQARQTNIDFKEGYLAFIARVKQAEKFLSAHEALSQKYKERLLVQWRVLFHFSKSTLFQFQDSLLPITAPTTEMDHRNNFTIFLSKKLSEFTQTIDNSKKCHGDQIIYLNNLDLPRRIVNKDSKYVDTIKSWIPDYITNVIENGSIIDVDACNDEGPPAVHNENHNQAKISVVRFQQYYNHYNKLETKKFTCDPSNDQENYSDSDNIEKLIADVENFLDDINSSVSDYTDRYGSDVKATYQNIKTNYPSSDIQEMGRTVAEQAKELEKKSIIGSVDDTLTVATIDEQLSKINSAIDSNRDHLPTEIYDDFQSKIKLLNEYKGKHTEITGGNSNNADRKRTINEKIVAKTNALQNYNNDVVDAQNGATAQILAIDAVMRGLDLKVDKVEEISIEMGRMMFAAQSKLADIVSKTETQLAPVEGQNDIATEIRLLDGDLKNNAENLKQLEKNFKQTTDDITQIITVQIPDAIKAANRKYMDSKIAIEESIEKLQQATDILDTLNNNHPNIIINQNNINNENNIPLLKLAHTSMSTKIKTMKNDLDDYTTENNKVETEFRTFIASTQAHPSKLLHSIAVKYFEPVVAAYENIHRNVDTDSSNLATIEPNVDKIGTDCNTVKQTVDSLKELVGEASGKADVILKQKTTLIQNILETPKQFKHRVDELVNLVNLDLNADSLLTQSEAANSNFNTLQMLQNATLTNINDLETKVSNIPNDINDLKDSKKKMMDAVNVKQEQLTKLLTDAGHTYLDTTKLKEYSAQKHDTLRDVRKSKKSQTKRSTAANGALYENAKQKVAIQQEMTQNFFNVIKNFYASKYNVHLDKFEGKYSEINAKYVELMNRMKLENDAFEKRVSEIVSRLGEIKSDESTKYKNEIDSMNSFIDELKDSFYNIETSTDTDTYDSLIGAGRKVLSSLYSSVKQQSGSYFQFIDKTRVAISNMKIVDANYDKFSNKVSDIVNEAKQMMNQYEAELQDQYVKNNKVTFEDVDKQKFFDSVEQNHDYIQALSLSDVDVPDTTLYSELAAEIKTETEKLTNIKLKSNLEKLNIESIVSKFYPDLESAINRLSPTEGVLRRDIKLAADQHRQLTTIQTDFNDEKKSFESSYKQIEDLKEQYDSKIQQLLALSNDKNVDDSQSVLFLVEQMARLENEKTNLLSNLKQKSSTLKQSFNDLLTKKGEYEQMSTSLRSTLDSLASLKADSDPELTSLKAENVALTTQLETALLMVVKKNTIFKTLIPVEETFELFIKQFPAKLDAQTNETITTIETALKLLSQVKSTTTNDKAKFEVELNKLSQYYELNRDNFNNDMSNIVASQNERLSKNQRHCHRYIEYSNGRKTQVDRDSKLLGEFFRDNSTTMLSYLTNAISDLNCCVKILNGHECDQINNLERTQLQTLNVNRCIAYIGDFDANHQHIAVHGFMGDLTRLMQQALKLRTDGDNDEFGIDVLNRLPTDSKILDDNIEILERLLKAEFKKTKLIEVKQLLSTIDTDVEDHQAIVSSYLDLIAPNKISINNKLTEYEQKIDIHSEKYTEAKNSFTKLSSEAGKLAKSIVGTAKNTYISRQVMKHPTAAYTIIGYAKDLMVDEEFVKKSNKVINAFKTDAKQLIETSESNSEKYTKLKKTLENLRNQLKNVESNNELINKTAVLQQTQRISLELTDNHSQIESTRDDIVSNGKDAISFSIRVNRDYDNSVVKMSESIRQMKENTSQTKSLLKGLNSMSQSSLTINKLLGSLSTLERELEHFLGSLKTKKEQSTDVIGAKIINLTDSKKNKKAQLESDKINVDDKFNQFFKSYNVLDIKAREADTDTPPKIIEKRNQYLQLISSIERDCIDIEQSIDSYAKDGEDHYVRQEISFSGIYSNLKTQSQNSINQINALVIEITQLSLENNPQLTQNKYDSLLKSVEGFLAKNKNISFAVVDYNKDEVDINIGSFTDEKARDIEQQMTEIETTLITITTNDKGTKTEERVIKRITDNNSLFYSPPTSSSLNKTTTEKNITIGNSDNLKSKDFFSMIVVFASVAAVGIVGAAGNFINKHLKKQQIYQKCDKIYVEA